MKISLAKTSGFCFGVRRALQIARATAKIYDQVYMLGDIVHNEDVVREIQKAGIKKVKRLSCGKNKAFLIRAHGVPLKTYQQARKLGYKIIDATCVMVKEIHKIAREMEKNGFKIIVLGDRKHAEVRGIVGQLKNKAIVIDIYKPLPIKQIRKIRKAAIVVQSTQDVQKVLAIVKRLKRYIPQLKFYNTICKPTRTRQQEIKTLARNNDLVIIIGSKNSANTRRLYEIALSLNRRSFRVSHKDDLRKKWFSGVQKVGIMSGASTPDSTTQAVINQIRHYSG